MTLGADHDEPVHVAVVGSGPSGFYAAEALLRSEWNTRVTMIERLPTPYGLVRSGVAPDHQTLKSVILVYDRIARSEGFHYVGNVAVGRDISISELRANFHAVILAYGAQTDRRMGIPGEDIAGSYTATEFVGWYNGHPDYRDLDFDLSSPVAVIIGQGNVAADVCRILAKPIDDLRHSDIADHALEILAESKIEEIHVVGRRGPAQAKFTAKELRELGEIPNCIAEVHPDDCALNEASAAEIADRANAGALKNMKLFREFAEHTKSSNTGSTKGLRRIRFHFRLSPKAIIGNERVERVAFFRNRLHGPAFAQIAHPTSGVEEIDCGLVFRSIGYRGASLPGVPFDEARGVIPNEAGRVIDRGAYAHGLFVTGWIKRGPQGIIGTNRADSLETVESLIADLPALTRARKPGFKGLIALIEDRDVRPVDLAEWLVIDETETARGRAKDKPREKITRVEEMLALLSQRPQRPHVKQ
ncbi:MAG: FAD-dependent oxidoreductase [Methyloceanibacter sp.]|nr:FAD-dependent oxidoreductase [Methyloceanibacter sp.]